MNDKIEGKRSPKSKEYFEKILKKRAKVASLYSSSSSSFEDEHKRPESIVIYKPKNVFIQMPQPQPKSKPKRKPKIQDFSEEELLTAKPKKPKRKKHHKKTTTKEIKKDETVKS